MQLNESTSKEQTKPTNNDDKNPIALILLSQRWSTSTERMPRSVNKILLIVFVETHE